jgi:hypothetical protein
MDTIAVLVWMQYTIGHSIVPYEWSVFYAIEKRYIYLVAGNTKHS